MITLLQGFSFRRRVAAALILSFGIALYAGFEYESLLAQKKTTATTQQNATTGAKAEATKTASTTAKKSTTAAPVRPRTSLWALFRAGGPFMWPLLLASIISLMVVLERFYFHGTTRLSSRTFQQDLSDAIEQDGLEGAAQYVNGGSNNALASVMSEGLRISPNEPELFSRGVEREAASTIARSERGLPILAAVSTLAPLIGFLGTVSGMIGAFDAIATADTVNAKVVAGGIKEALITTAAGLIVALPAMTFFQYFTGKVNGFATDVEQAGNQLYKQMLKLKAS